MTGTDGNTVGRALIDLLLTRSEAGEDDEEPDDIARARADILIRMLAAAGMAGADPTECGDERTWRRGRLAFERDHPDWAEVNANAFAVAHGGATTSATAPAHVPVPTPTEDELVALYAGRSIERMRRLSEIARSGSGDMELDALMEFADAIPMPARAGTDTDGDADGCVLGPGGDRVPAPARPRYAVKRTKGYVRINQLPDDGSEWGGSHPDVMPDRPRLPFPAPIVAIGRDGSVYEQDSRFRVVSSGSPSTPGAHGPAPSYPREWIAALMAITGGWLGWAALTASGNADGFVMRELCGMASDVIGIEGTYERRTRIPIRGRMAADPNGR